MKHSDNYSYLAEALRTFTMFLINLKLWNFRIFGTTGSFDIQKPDLDLDFSKGVNVLIGENDSGKTAIIDAIKMVLKTHSAEWIKVEDEDFFRDADRFRIECRFKDINDDEAKYFTEWIDWVVNDKKIGEPYLTVYTTFRAGTIRLCLQISKRELMMLAIY